MELNRLAATCRSCDVQELLGITLAALYPNTSSVVCFLGTHGAKYRTCKMPVPSSWHGCFLPAEFGVVALLVFLACCSSTFAGQVFCDNGKSDGKLVDIQTCWIAAFLDECVGSYVTMNLKYSMQYA